MKRIISLMGILVFIACSSMSEKKVLKDEIVMNDGVYKMKSWTEDLHFKRVSWYSRAFMEFDFYMAKIDKDSPFNSWLEGSEIDLQNSCPELFIVVSTDNFSKVLNDGMFKDQLEKNSLKEVSAPNFINNFKLHPDFVRWNMTMYKSRLFCSSKEITEVSIEFPSFHTTTFEI
ncbi:MAG: hypothetical protein H6621_02870 [Halobacteriovoraceae bacterium]|nr:hypothetical protein [Halobacteriovoraceae bacterium]MCB9093987.1 hypothetical protein [Halobacteriovoraceae bacterium]